MSVATSVEAPSDAELITAVRGGDLDAYGTLLSTESIAKELASHFGTQKAGTIAQEWRKYQLEYTWRLNSMGTTSALSLPTARNTEELMIHGYKDNTPPSPA